MSESLSGIPSPPPGNGKAILTADSRRDRDHWGPMGVTGLKHSFGEIRAEFLRELQGYRGMQNFREMAFNDPISGAILTLWRLLFQQTSKHLTPADAKRPSALDCQRFVQECMADMSHGWMTLEDEYCTGFIYGNSLHSVVMKARKGEDPGVGLYGDPLPVSKFKDGRLGWESIRLRNQLSIRKWVFDRDVPVAAVQTDPNTFAQHEIPLSRCVHFRSTDILNNPEGLSMLRHGWVSYRRGSSLEESETIGLHRSNNGMPVMEMPPAKLASTVQTDVDEVNRMLDTLSAMDSGSKAAFAVPAEWMGTARTGYKFYLASVTTAAPGFDIAIRRHESRRAMTMFADFILLGHDKVGARNVADNKTSMQSLALSAIVDRFCETFTRQAIHPLCAVNGFSPEDYPRLDHGDINVPDIGVLADFVNTLVGADLIQKGPELQKYLQKVGGLPEEQQVDFTVPDGGAPAPAATPTPAGAGADGKALLSEGVQEQDKNDGLQISYLSNAFEKMSAIKTPETERLAAKMVATMDFLLDRIGGGKAGDPKPLQLPGAPALPPPAARM